MKYYSIEGFGELIGVTPQILRNCDKVGKLKPCQIWKSGYRYYPQQQFQHYPGLKGENPAKKKVVGYCRVSSNKQKDNLVRQVENAKSYMCKLQGKRANKAKKIIKELLEDDNSPESQT